ncbi:MAG: hypothetical protein NTW58_06535 [Actinobacteria bacterium]|nr:hypothetical protein [Actinomycetota bacterium]
MDFFDDDATSQAPVRERSSSPSRRRSNPRRTRIQRILILAAILFIIVFALAWWARSCQQSRKVASYRTYFEGVAAAISDSAALGKQLDQIVASPTKFSRKELTAKLAELSAKQNEIAVRADRLEPPDTLSSEQSVFAEGMKVRADGYKLFETTMLGTLGKKKVNPAKLAALAGYFSGPDAYYTSRVYLPARNTLSQQGVTDVLVPTATFYLNAKTFDTARLEQMLNSMGSSTKLAGIHGVGLISVTAQPGDIALTKAATTDVPASAGLSFDVKVQNQGDVAEENVAVTAELKLPGGSVLTKGGTIATIASGQTQTVTIQGFAIPAEALSKVSTLTVTAGPVPGERVKTNNVGQFKILLQLQ